MHRPRRVDLRHAYMPTLAKPIREERTGPVLRAVALDDPAFGDELLCRCAHRGAQISSRFEPLRRDLFRQSVVDLQPARSIHRGEVVVVEATTLGHSYAASTWCS